MFWSLGPPALKPVNDRLTLRKGGKRFRIISEYSWNGSKSTTVATGVCVCVCSRYLVTSLAQSNPQWSFLLIQNLFPPLQNLS